MKTKQILFVEKDVCSSCVLFEHGLFWIFKLNVMWQAGSSWETASDNRVGPCVRCTVSHVHRYRKSCSGDAEVEDRKAGGGCATGACESRLCCPCSTPEALWTPLMPCSLPAAPDFQPNHPITIVSLVSRFSFPLQLIFHNRAG